MFYGKYLLDKRQGSGMHVWIDGSKFLGTWYVFIIGMRPFWNAAYEFRLVSMVDKRGQMRIAETKRVLLATQ